MKIFLQPYGGHNSNSGVTAYALLTGGMLVQFQGGEAYLYDEHKPGAIHLKRMVALAQSGRGLSTYISQHIGDRYAGRFSAEELATLSRTRK